MREEFLEATSIVVDVELVQHLAVRQFNHHTVEGAANIHCNSN